MYNEKCGGGAMISVKPNTNMSSEEARKFLLDFLSRPNDCVNKIPVEDLQKVVDSVLSIKKTIERENRYDRISSVDFVGNNDGDISLSASEEGVSKNDKIYISDKHIWQDSYRFSLVSLLFHESTHNIQHFKLEDLSKIVNVPLKPELKNPANLTDFKRDIMSFVYKNNGEGEKSILHMFESDYFGQAREIEAYKSQYRYMTEILRDLGPIMNQSFDGMAVYNSYKRSHDKYFPFGHNTRHEINDELWKSGRVVITNYMNQKLQEIQVLSEYVDEEKYRYLYASNISNVIAGLHFNYNKDILNAIAPHIYNMPEETFDDMSNKAMVINSLLTSTMISYSPKLLATLGGLFKKLSSHPENGMIRENGQRNIRYSIEKFYEDYCYLGKTQLDMAINDSLSSESSLDFSKD